MSVKNTWLLSGLLALNALASWPHWLWMGQRFNDGSDDPWGIVAVLTILTLVWLDKDQWRLPNQRILGITAIFTIMASVSWGKMPPIIAAAFAVLGIAWLISGILPRQRPLMPLLMLAVLALPLVASLNFYVGYPLRWFCAQATAQVLSLLGLTVTPQGAALLWNGQSILIDAPCAGIAMLWLGLYLAALFSFFNSSAIARCWLNTGMAMVTVVIANVLRNAILFYKEAGIVQLPHWTHEAIGLVIFGMIVPLIYWSSTAYGKSGDNHEMP